MTTNMSVRWRQTNNFLSQILFQDLNLYAFLSFGLKKHTCADNGDGIFFGGIYGIYQKMQCVMVKIYTDGAYTYVLS